METLTDGFIVAHPITKISLDSRDKTNVRVEFDLQIFKSSTLTVSYDDSLGALKSIYNIGVESFYAFPITNEVALDFVPVLDWLDTSSLVITRNTLSGVSGGRAYSPSTIKAGESAIVQFNTEIADSIVLGLDSSSGSEGHNTMDYYILKSNGEIEYMKLNEVTYSHIPIGKGILRMRLDGTTIYFEASFDNGLTFSIINSTPQPQLEMWIKVYSRITSEMVNLVAAGITTPATNTYVLTDYVVNDYVL
ncbi:hypothetical protein [Pedobacter steynii]